MLSICVINLAESRPEDINLRLFSDHARYKNDTYYTRGMYTKRFGKGSFNRSNTLCKPKQK